MGEQAVESAIAAGANGRRPGETCSSEPRASGPGPGHVAVVGGGLAGMACSLRLAEAGLRVTLLETRVKLGGRATSFRDASTGLVLDNSQHIVLGCCTRLLDFYRRLGVDDRIQWHEAICFLTRLDLDDHASAPAAPAEDPATDPADAEHPRITLDRLAADPLPAPLHMTRALLRMKMLSRADKRHVIRAMLALVRMSRQRRDRLSTISFAHWLERFRPTRRALDRFWSPVIVGACNETIDRVAARYGIQVFQEGFTDHRRAYRMGLASVPLVELYDGMASRLQQAGGALRLRTSVESLTPAAQGAQGPRVESLRLVRDGSFAADAFVLAVPADRLARLWPDTPDAPPTPVEPEKLGVSPIIGIHLWYDGSFMATPHAALSESPLHWVFDKGPATWSDGTECRQYHGVISAAHEAVDTPGDLLLERADRELRRFFPDMKGMRRLGGRVVKEKRATFSIAPGVDAHRPGPTSGYENVFLAGDWCDTGWPATMEGAVRSGERAAAALLSSAGRTPATPVDDLSPASLIARMRR